MLSEDTILQVIEPDIHPGFNLPTLYRYDRPSGVDDRYYYRIEGDKRIGYLSVTSAVNHILYGGGISRELDAWKESVGHDYAKFYSRFRAEYGTQLHIECVDFLRNGYLDWDEMKSRQIRICQTLGYHWAVENWVHEICKDVASFVTFCFDKNVVVKFAEVAVHSDKYKLAGAIDLGLELDFNKTRVNAIVDIKSGKKGFYDSHKAQLHIYRKLWNDLFEDIWKVTHIFNFAPTDWRETSPVSPKYKFQNQEDYVRKEILEQDMMIPVTIGAVIPPDNFIHFSGVTELGSKPEIKVINFEDYRPLS